MSGSGRKSRGSRLRNADIINKQRLNSFISKIQDPQLHAYAAKLVDLAENIVLRHSTAAESGRSEMGPKPDTLKNAQSFLNIQNEADFIDRVESEFTRERIRARLSEERRTAHQSLADDRQRQADSVIPDLPADRQRQANSVLAEIERIYGTHADITLKAHAYSAEKASIGITFSNWQDLIIKMLDEKQEILNQCLKNMAEQQVAYLKENFPNKAWSEEAQKLLKDRKATDLQIMWIDKEIFRNLFFAKTPHDFISAMGDSGRKQIRLRLFEMIPASASWRAQAQVIIRSAIENPSSSNMDILSVSSLDELKKNLNDRMTPEQKQQVQESFIRNITPFSEHISQAARAILERSSHLELLFANSQRDFFQFALFKMTPTELSEILQHLKAQPIKPEELKEPIHRLLDRLTEDLKSSDQEIVKKAIDFITESKIKDCFTENPIDFQKNLREALVEDLTRQINASFLLNDDAHTDENIEEIKKFAIERLGYATATILTASNISLHKDTTEEVRLLKMNPQEIIQNSEKLLLEKEREKTTGPALKQVKNKIKSLAKNNPNHAHLIQPKIDFLTDVKDALIRYNNTGTPQSLPNPDAAVTKKVHRHWFTAVITWISNQFPGKFKSDTARLLDEVQTKASSALVFGPSHISPNPPSRQNSARSSEGASESKGPETSPT
jgi:hypothetical protein